jgi:hypothetical protein
MLLSRLRAYREVYRMRRYKSKMATPVYHDYWRQCRRSAGDLGIRWTDAARHAARFDAEGVTSFRTPETEAIARAVCAAVREEEAKGLPIWDSEMRYLGFYTRFPELQGLFDGPLGDFIKAVNGSHYKIYYGLLYKSVYGDGRAQGSQLWHSDGGPGTCLNVMFYLSDVEASDGAMECLPWPYSFPILKREMLTREPERRIQAEAAAGRELSRMEKRAIRCEWYARAVEQSAAAHVVQPVGPAGTVVPFRNNVLHKGGLPGEPGRTRYACVFHVYPSVKPAPLARYAAQGIEKRGSYPADPAEDF